MIHTIIQGGVTALQQNKMGLAESLANQALSIDPKNAYANYILGAVLINKNHLKEAIRTLKKGLKSEPKNIGIHNLLGAAYQKNGDNREAILSFRACIKYEPNFYSAYNNLGVIYKSQGQYKDAILAYKQAVKINPDFGDALNNLAIMQKDLGYLDEAKDYFHQAIASGNCTSNAGSNYLLCLNYFNDLTAEDIFFAHRDWGSRISPQSTCKSNLKAGSKVRNIGYVSADFRAHSVSFFLLPLFKNHNIGEYSIYCYSTSKIEDHVTSQLRSFVTHWRDVASLQIDDFYDIVQKDEIDVLIDLSGHTGGNKLSLFAKKPAPMQITWLGYPNTTGLTQIDYRITDEVADPPSDARIHTEKLLFLQDGFLCFEGDKTIVASEVPPVVSNDYITFGSFNNLTKITHDVIDSWSRILLSVPNSILLLKAGRLNDNFVKQKVIDRFKRQGIPEKRLKLHGPIYNDRDHLLFYDRIDIALDTFPYNGTTTTFEALWMGVPVISMEMDRHASRVGKSILTRLELNNFVASSVDFYVEIAVSLSLDIAQISSLKKELRLKMEASSLCDGEKFANNFEKALEQGWTLLKGRSSK
jgi:predicted O-linked N-acetylglucosamine transferase (SPINDLY family)